MVMLQLKQIDIQPGHRVTLKNVSWEAFEAILAELGESRATRVAYSQGILEIRMPFPKHEQAKVIIGEMVVILLDELEIDYEPFGSTTFKRKDMAASIEPDNCFYIQNHAVMIGKDRLDLTVDPPPDLAIEVDVTSITQFDTYEALKVPELWRFENGKLQIKVLNEDKYIESEISSTFPDFPIISIISQFVKQSRTVGTSCTLRAFRQWMREQKN